jgi:hypothetical protein
VYIAAYVVAVVHEQHPVPNAGFPVRFEKLHELGLFAAVSLLPVASGARSPSSGQGAP